MDAIQQGERRWSSVMSMDIVGFTELTQRLGEETAFDLLQSVLDIAKHSIMATGGHVVDTAGDGILATFGAPTALENAPLQACRAAKQIIASLAAQSAPHQDKFGMPPQVRIGIAGGNVMIVQVTDSTVKVVGDAVNMAARVQSLSMPNTILLTDNIHKEALGGIQVTNREEVRLKGFDKPIVVHELQKIIQTATRFEGTQNRSTQPLVSRTDELNTALATFDSKSAQSSLLISGTAGIGKSRLLNEVLNNLDPIRKALTGQCAPDKTARPFAPFEPILQGLSQLGPGTPVRDQLSAIQAAYPESCSDEGINRFCSPRSEEKDPVGRILHNRVFLTQLFAAVARQKPHVFVFEDIHWADGTSLDTLKELSRAEVPLIATTRDVKEDLLTSQIKHIALTPLDNVGIAALVAHLSAHPLSPALTDLLVQKAEGIPLIAEELTFALRSSDQLQETQDGLVLETGGEVILSGNLQQLVLSRVDRLDTNQKTVLQVASAIGRDFDLNLLKAASNTPLPDIEAFEGIITKLDETTGRFSHALIREAVYIGLLTKQRKDIHLSIANAIAEQQPSSGFANLANHYVKADQPKKAAPTLVQAGQEALQAYDLLLTDRLLHQAFEIAEAQPDALTDEGFAKLAMLWTRTLSITGNYGRIMRFSGSMRARLANSSYTPDRSIAYALIALAQTGARDYAGARDLLVDTIADAQSNSDAYGAAWAKTNLARVYDETSWATASDARRLCREVIPVAMAFEDRHLHLTALYIIIASYRGCGRLNRSLEAVDALETMSDEFQDRRARGYANSARAHIFSAVGDPETAGIYIDRAQEDFLPNTTDSNVIIGIQRFVEIFTKHPDDVHPKIEQMIAISKGLEDYNLIHAYMWVGLIFDLKNSRLTYAWSRLNQLRDAYLQKQNVNVIRQIHLTRAEFLLAVAGLIDPDAEAPPDRPKFPRPRPNLADIATFIRLKLTAKRMAIVDLQQIIDVDPEKTGVNFARAHIGLGLIAASRKQTLAAREHLETGLAIAVAEDFTLLVNRAQRALETL